MNMRMAVPHSTDVGQMQHNMNQQGALLQSYKSAKDKEKQELQQTQVRDKDNAEGEKIKDNPDRRQQGGYSSSGKRRGNSSETEPEEETIKMAVDQFRGRNIDISG